ncbi:MAG: hypothetical protein C5B49_02140 [Bdellovibrio sp.]|nr:MAG: hypothetical protein C5B49_02140 [Bdellovibrio sp.]
MTSTTGKTAPFAFSGLSAETIDKIQSTLRQYPEVETALLYGSRAMGKHKPGSDIDVVLEGAGLNLETLNKIRNDLDDLLLPYTFDVSILHQIENKDLVDHIERVGKTVYQRT